MNNIIEQMLSKYNIKNTKEAYGIEGGDTFYLFMDGKKISDIPQDFIEWADAFNLGLDTKETLPVPGVYNEKMKQGFYKQND